MYIPPTVQLMATTSAPYHGLYPLLNYDVIALPNVVRIRHFVTVTEKVTHVGCDTILNALQEQVPNCSHNTIISVS